MSKRDWRTPTVFALTGLLCLGSILYAAWHTGASQAEKRMSREQSAEQHIKYAEDRIDESCTQADRTPLLKCVHDEIKAAQDHSRSESDLDAQMAMALWAKVMTLSGIVGSILASGGLYLVWRTLGTTADAVDAASAANQIMRDGQRPWVVLKREVICEFADKGFLGQITWNYDFENKGKSPAYDVMLSLTFIKRRHFQHMSDQLQGYLEDVLSKRRLQTMAVIFPNERTEIIKYEGRSSVRYQEDAFSVSPITGDGHVMMMACLTYRLGLHSNDFGYDVMMFGFEDRKGFIGPWRHEMLEHASARLVG